MFDSAISVTVFVRVQTGLVQQADRDPKATTPPLLVRLSFRMGMPIAPEWRPWAIEQIEQRFGPNPSDEDRDITFYSTGASFNGFAPGIGKIPRAPMSVRKANWLRVVGGGTDTYRGSPWVDASAMWERLPQRVWPWVPVITIAAFVGFVGGLVALVLVLV